MLTTDPIYFRPLLPVITIKNTANNTTLYTYNSFTDSGTTDKVLYCSVNLSQNTHGEFTIQFEDQNKSLESTVTVGSRVQIDCGKQSSSLIRLISGLVRKKGYSRGANNKVLYTISGSSTGIRLNELLTYTVSEAAQLANGQVDLTDVTRKADILLASGLNVLTADGILSISNLAANSDVETFIVNTNIQYGELQDLINYYEDQSGGEVIVDTSDLVNFRHEIKNNLFGRGFTIKNNNDNKANDDADDTMYLVNKNWSYEDDFFKSSNYANRFYALLAAETVPSTREDMGYFSTGLQGAVNPTNQEFAQKFRPTHSHFLPGDIMVVAGQSTITPDLSPWVMRFRVCNDSAGVPANVGGVVANIDFQGTNFEGQVKTSVDINSFVVAQDQLFYNSSNTRIDSFDLDISKNYWLILSNDNVPASSTNHWGYNPNIDSVVLIHTISPSTDSDGGANWLSPGGMLSMIFALPRRRSHSFFMYDPKGMQAVSSGLAAGLPTDTLLTDASTQINSFDSMYRFLQQQTYNLARPRTVYNFSTVTAPNIPPFPGDPIIISDDILGLSTSGNQVALTTCGDMTYQWGNMGSGSYEAPTKLSINAIAIPPRYR